MLGSAWLAIMRGGYGYKPGSLRDLQVEQTRKRVQVIRWLNVELPSLNGQKVRRG
jgi:hypothetical protein